MNLLPRIKAKLRPNKELEAQLKAAQDLLRKYQLGWEPGHFYSPIPDLEQIRQREAKIWQQDSKVVPGINLNEEKQVKLFDKLAGYYPLQPWRDEKQNGWRFHFDNPNFSYGESLILFTLLMHIQPSNIIEIGSGYSSCVLLDTNAQFLRNKAHLTFIEPYPQLLESLINEEDKARTTIVPQKLQDADFSVFSSLKEGDVLLIDSTHVSKVDSDVNHILFDILPSLAAGVYIHFHDIYYPFEYPRQWIFQGRAWNEAYALRAFLQFNNAFEIIFFNSFFGKFHHDLLKEKMPLCSINPGSSIWLKKVN